MQSLQGLKPNYLVAGTARLKPCPDTKRHQHNPSHNSNRSSNAKRR